MSPSKALDALVQGNKRFYEGKAKTLNQDMYRRKSVKEYQNPFAVIVACADSRVSPEILFDQGIGDLFVVRVAGNVIGPYELESIEYAVKHLNSSYVLVMGHQNCGAVDAVIHGQVADILYISQLIQPAVNMVRKSSGNNMLLKATQQNARNMKSFLLKSPTISELKAQGKVDCGSAYYDFSTGKVKML